MTQRTKSLRVSVELMLSLLADGKPATAVSPGLPADARIVGVRDECRAAGIVTLIIESAEFPEHGLGRQAPEIDVYHIHLTNPA